MVSVYMMGVKRVITDPFKMKMSLQTTMMFDFIAKRRFRNLDDIVLAIILMNYNLVDLPS